MPKAVVCEHVGPYTQGLCVKEIPSLDNLPPSGTILVRVRCAGLAFPDLLTVEGKHYAKRTPPFIPGNGIAGEVLRVGADVNGWHVGDRIAGQVAADAVITDFLFGALAEEALVSESSCWAIPEGIAFETAVALQRNYPVVHQALKVTGGLNNSETLLILGASGACGLAAIDLGKALGAVVIACASTRTKMEACRAAGADIVIDYETGGSEAFMRKLKEAGVYGKPNVIFDPVGGPYAEAAFRALAPGGRYLVFGFAAGGTDPKTAFPSLPLNLLLVRGQKILGAIGAPPAARREVIEMAAAKRVKPSIYNVYPFKDFIDAFGDLATRKAIGTVVISIGERNVRSSKL